MVLPKDIKLRDLYDHLNLLVNIIVYKFTSAGLQFKFKAIISQFHSYYNLLSILIILNIRQRRGITNFVNLTHLLSVGLYWNCICSETFGITPPSPDIIPRVIECE